MTQKKHWIGGNLLIIRTQTLNKHWIGGNPLSSFFCTFIFLLSWDDLTNQFFSVANPQYYLIKFYLFCITYTTFPFMLKFVLVLGIHFKAFTAGASLPLHSRARYFLGHASEGTYRITISFLNNITSEIQSQIFPYPF